MQDLSEESLRKLKQVQWVIKNHMDLKNKGLLEKEWTDAYLFAPCFRGIPFKDLKMVFDACDKRKLGSMYPFPERELGQQDMPFRVFRGCVGKEFVPGMSWTTCFEQAIKYPKRSKLFSFYGDEKDMPCSVWEALVQKEDVYCYFNQFEPEFITCPEIYWRVNVPQEEFEYSTSS